MTIFELSENAQLLSQLIEEAQANGEEDMQALIDTLEANQEALDLKLNNVGWLIAQTETEAKAYEEQERRFKEKKDRAKKKIDQLKSLITYVLTSQNINKLKTDHFAYSFRKSVATKVVDVDKVPAEFVKEKITKTPNLSEIKKYIKEHGEQEWAKLEERQSLQVK